jgi:homoserine dehydrogenase
MTSPLRIGVAGLGTVGAALCRLLVENRDAIAIHAGRPIEVVAVTARDRGKDRGLALADVHFHDSAAALAQDPAVEAFVELIGGEEGPARASVEAALAAGKHVVTANKALIAAHGLALARLAEEKGCTLAFEAAVAGGVPAIRTLRDAMTGNRIDRLHGILNGTSNYIQTRMEAEELDFATCLADAQRLGYAEADPTFDVDGFDTAHKLAILASLAFGTRIAAETVYVEGIRAVAPEDIKAARELGFRIKLLGLAAITERGLAQRVYPVMVPHGSAIADVDGVLNAVSYHGSAIGELVLVGPGAGGEATASAVIADLTDIARGLLTLPLGRPVEALGRPPALPIDEHVGAYYIRLSVTDRPGAFAAIAGRMGNEGISLESIVQHHERGASLEAHPPGSQKTVILITYDTTEAALRRALVAISDDGVIAKAPRVIRIEHFD